MSNEITTVVAYAGEIDEYSPTAAALSELREKFSNVIFPVETSKGMKDAKEVRQKLVKLRTGLESKRKELKEPALRRCQSIDAEAKEITTAIKAIEEPIDAQIKTEEARIEAEKQAKAAREAEIRDKIHGIRNLPLQLATASSDEILAEKEALAAFTPPQDVFGEFTDDCQAALNEAIMALEDLHARVKGQEAAAALVEAQRQQIEEAERLARAKLDEERRQFEAERAAYEAEKRAFEAQRAAETPELAQTGSIAEPAGEEAQPDVMAGVIEALEMPVVSVSDWNTRRLAIATADQFHALAMKVGIVGFAEFSQELEVVADTLRSGQYDGALASADHEAIVAADTNLLDATVNSIDALTEDAKEAA